MRITGAILCLVLLAICGMAVAQPMDVPANHWAYDSISKLAAKGFITGYPDGKFLGDRTMTRYEMACIVARCLDQVDKALPVKSETPAAVTSTAPAASSEPAVAAPEVTKEDLEAVNKLVQEFKVELAVMGTRMDKVESSLAELEQKVENINSIITDEEGPVESTRADVKKLKTVTFSGFLQNRYQTMDFGNQDKAAKSQADTFLVRRARVSMTAQPTDLVRGVLSFDVGKNSFAAKDAYFQYIFKGNEQAGPSFFVGQMNWPFGYENPTSDTVREAPERSLVVRRFFPGERDQGAKLVSGLRGPLFWQIGAFNGTGTNNSSAADGDGNKSLVVDVKRNFGDLDLGASYYSGRGVFNSANVLQSGLERRRIGANLQYYMNKLTLKGEYVSGKGVDTADASWDQTRSINGYWGQLSYNATKDNSIVARFQSITNDPVQPKYGGRNSWDVGMIHYIDLNSKVKVFYEFNHEQANPISNNGWTAEWLMKY